MTLELFAFELAILTAIFIIISYIVKTEEYGEFNIHHIVVIYEGRFVSLNEAMLKHAKAFLEKSVKRTGFIKSLFRYVAYLKFYLLLRKISKLQSKNIDAKFFDEYYLKILDVLGEE